MLYYSRYFSLYFSLYSLYSLYVSACDMRKYPYATACTHTLPHALR